jgi:glutathione S-transferase
VIRYLDVGTSIQATVARLGSGSRVGKLGARPEQLLELYDFESCPFCRKAREALSILDLDALIYPCPKFGPTYRPELMKRGGKALFPYLVDPNTGVEMYESNDIVAYLFEHYGDGRVPILLKSGPQNDFTTMMASLSRPFLRGRIYNEAQHPERPLELYSFEASPYCRIVREALTSYELPYVLRNVARGSSRRAAFIERSGKMMVPYLVDPNTGVEMFESADIVQYLADTYAA